MDQIVLFGDSLTQFSDDQAEGFVFKAAVENAYIRRLDVVNRGYSGYNTNLALRVLPHLIAPPTPTSRIRLFSIFLGANDARLPDSSPEPVQSVPAEQYKANLISILTHPSVAAHGPQYLLVTPPPVDERMCEAADAAKGYSANDRPMRTAEHTAFFAQVVRDLGRERGVPVVDLWTAFMRHAGWTGAKEGPGLPGSPDVEVYPKLQELLNDGLHFTGAGYRVLFDEFTATIARDLPHLSPERLEMVYPAWNDAERWEHFAGPRLDRPT